MPDFLVFASIVPKLLGAKVALNFFELMPEVFAEKFNISANHVVVRLIRWEEKISAKFADHIILANGICQQECLESRGIPVSKMSAVLNVPDDSVFYPRPFQGCDDGSFRLITHGSILERYGLQTMIKAVPLLTSEIPGLEIKVLGEGEYRPQLEELARSLGVTDRVHFTGLVSYEEMLSFIAQAHLGIVSLLPQKQPQMPCKLFEYLAMAKPAVCTSLPAVTAYFDNNSVMFYEPDNELELARCILALYKNTKKREALAASGSAAYQKYRWDKMKNEYLKVFDRLTGDERCFLPEEKRTVPDRTREN
jgi:glycosyltransferase involved in cell wall biosynthesis